MITITDPMTAAEPRAPQQITTADGRFAVIAAGHGQPLVDMLDALGVSERARGAQGFVAGRSLWKEAVGQPAAERRAFLDAGSRGRARRARDRLARHEGRRPGGGPRARVRRSDVRGADRPARLRAVHAGDAALAAGERGGRRPGPRLAGRPRVSA